jgi:hypothetical protein
MFEPASEISLVPVSPIVYPGVAGLEVHSACLAAARRGAFERGRARRLRAIESFDRSDGEPAETRPGKGVVTEEQV